MGEGDTGRSGLVKSTKSPITWLKQSFERRAKILPVPHDGRLVRNGPGANVYNKIRHLVGNVKSGKLLDLSKVWIYVTVRAVLFTSYNISQWETVKREQTATGPIHPEHMSART